MPAAWNLLENETAASPPDSWHQPLPPQMNKADPYLQHFLRLPKNMTPTLIPALQGCWQIRTDPGHADRLDPGQRAPRVFFLQHPWAPA